MTPLIAMPGPWLPEGTSGREVADSLPPLAALDALLRRARRLADAPDWRAGVQRALGGDPGVPAAAVAACAVSLREGTSLCFAAPLHTVAGMSRVHLPPGGRVLLQPEEETALCADFNAQFGNEARLHVAAAGGGWLLEAACAAAARDPSPDDLIGATLHRRPAQGDAERALRRLGAESEMWLSAHPLNPVRERRGEPPLNALWFWNGAHAQSLPPLAATRLVAARGVADAWLAGLAAQAGQPLRDAVDFDSAMRQAPAQSQAGDLALLVPAPDNTGANGHYWRMLDERWIRPAMQALGARRISALRLQLGRTAWQLPPRPLGWLLPERRPWWRLSGEARP